MCKRCSLAAKGKVVLSVQDATEMNLYNHKGRMRQDKSTEVTNASGSGLGFMAHPSLVVDAYSSFPYGFRHTYFYSREQGRGPAEKRNKYKKLGMEEKDIL